MSYSWSDRYYRTPQRQMSLNAQGPPKNTINGVHKTFLRNPSVCSRIKLVKHVDLSPRLVTEKGMREQTTWGAGGEMQHLGNARDWEPLTGDGGARDLKTLLLTHLLQNIHFYPLSDSVYLSTYLATNCIPQASQGRYFLGYFS